MNKKNISVVFLVALLNAFAVFMIRDYVRSDHSDKSIILYWLFYPLLVIANIIFTLLIKKQNRALKQYLFYIIILLLLLFFPVMFTIY